MHSTTKSQTKMIPPEIRSPLLFSITDSGGDGKEKVEEKGGGISCEKQKIEKTYFEVLGLCCTSEVTLVQRILTPLQGVKDVSVVVPSKTVIVLHDSALISPSEIAKALNQARLEANVRVKGKSSHHKKWPSPWVIACGLLLGLSFLKYVYYPLRWFAVASVAVGIWPVLIKGFASIKNLTLDLNILILIEVAGTLALQDFWEAGTIIFLFLVAEWLQSHASHKANAVMSSLMSIAPQTATIAETGELVNVEQVKPGTILAVKTGEVVPIDSLVVEGSCEVDEKTLTGEAFPVPKQSGSTVWAGTININGYVSVKTIALSGDCVVAKMAKLVEEAQNKKSRFQRLIDECAKYYTPGIALVSLGVALVPVVMSLQNKNYWFHLALVVLVSACPCGLILSTPVSTFCALSNAASNGLLIKGGDYFEILAKVKTVAFDKTGTITRGEFIVSDFRCLVTDISANTLLYWISSIESKSSHPIADAVVYYGKSQSIEPKPEIVTDFKNFPGEGIAGKIDGNEIYVGNQRLGQRAGCFPTSDIKYSSDDGRTLGYVYSGGDVIGMFSLSDSCRSGAVDAITDLKSMGIRTAMLTGDSKTAAAHAYDQLKHALDEVHAELLPEDKARIVEDYKKSGATAMVGDGVNDAPALATADVGISMGVSGSALATETGHVILMSNDIRRIPSAIRLAKQTQRKVIENIVFSIVIKAAVLAVSFAGYPIIWVAVLADVMSCLLVTLNSMLLLRHSHEYTVGESNGFSGCDKGTCKSTSASKSVLDNKGCCATTGVNKNMCFSSNSPTRRFKTATCSSLDEPSACRSRKCDVDPLAHPHQHVGGSGLERSKPRCCSSKKSGQMKLPEGSSGGCCGGDANVDLAMGAEDCCKPLLASRACQKEECRDLEGQVTGCLGVKCPDEASSSQQTAESIERISHEVAKSNVEESCCSLPCVGITRTEAGSCCRSSMEGCCPMPKDSSDMNITEIISE